MKRWFVVPFIAANVSCLGLGLWGRNPGAVLAHGIVVVFLASLYVAPALGRILDGWPTVLLSLSGALIEYKTGFDWRVASASGLIATTGSLLYFFWLTKLERAPSPLRVGAPLPPFELEDLDGRSVSSGSLADKSTVFVFYRGVWCGFCTMNVRELARGTADLEKRGHRLVFVSPQPAEKSRALAERFGGSAIFLTDRGLAAARKLGINHEGGVPAGVDLVGYGEHTVLPTVVVVGKDGRVVSLDEPSNYRRRLDLGQLLERIDSLT